MQSARFTGLGHHSMSAAAGAFVLLFLLLLVSGLNAQAPDCTYAECALRIERMRLVRGVSGEVVGDLRGFTPEVDLLLEGPVDAARHARVVIDSHRKAQLYGLAWGLWLLGGSPGWTTDRADPWISRDALALSLPIAAFATLRAIRHGRTERDALNRSVWAYNRAFAPNSGTASLPTSRLEGAAWDYAPLVLGALGAGAGMLADGDRNAMLNGVVLGGLLGELIGLTQLMLTHRP